MSLDVSEAASLSKSISHIDHFVSRIKTQQGALKTPFKTHYITHATEKNPYSLKTIFFTFLFVEICFVASLSFFSLTFPQTRLLIKVTQGRPGLNSLLKLFSGVGGHSTPLPAASGSRCDRFLTAAAVITAQKQFHSSLKQSINNPGCVQSGYLSLGHESSGCCTA